MLPLVWGALGGGGAQMLGQMGQNEKADANRLLAAQTEQYSPWTGMHGDLQNATRGSVLGAGLQGGISGMKQMQEFNKASMDDEMAKAQLDAQKRSKNPWYGKPYDEKYNEVV